MKKNSDDLAINEETAKIYIGKLTSFLNKYKLSIVCSLLITTAVVAGTFIYSSIKNSRDEQASFILSEIMDLIKNDSNTGASIKDIESKINSMKDKYSSATSFKMAELIYASYQYDLGKYKEAAKNYEAAFDNLKNDPLFARISKAGSGYSYLMVKESKNAVSSFDIICSSKNYLNKDEAFFNKALSLKQLEEKYKYKEAFLETIKTNENSIYRQIVKEKFPG